MGFPCGLERCSIEIETKAKGLCSGCNDIHYCCKEHQREDWKRHKKECKEKAKGKVAAQEKTEEANPKFHLEYKKVHQTDRFGHEVLEKWFKNIQMQDMMQNMSLMSTGHCILNSFGTVEEILCKRWDYNVNAEPGILDFLCKDGNTVGRVWRDHPTLAKSLPFGTGIRSDGTLIHMTKMQNMRNTPSQKLQMERGKTYVSLGFVDLQQVKEANLNFNLD